MRVLSLVFSLILASCGGSTTNDDSGPLTPKEVEPVNEDPAAALPKCRPDGTAPVLGKSPWTVGLVTQTGWTVSKLENDNPEFIRIFLTKGSQTTGLEVKYHADAPDDWSTENYRLMPAPDENPPQDLLLETMATLRTWQTTHDGEPFVIKREGVADPYAGLPLCSEVASLGGAAAQAPKELTDGAPATEEATVKEEAPANGQDPATEDAASTPQEQPAAENASEAPPAQ